MMMREQIKVLAQKNQTTELNIRREYIQHLFLSYFYQQPQTKDILFKGGTALRIIYRSPRFSEDLDFSTRLSKVNVIENAILATLAAIEHEGIDLRIAEAKQTSGGYLAIIEGTFLGQTTIIQLEISLRKRDISQSVVTIANDFATSYVLVQLSQEQLIDEKLQALLTRSKPRDFYDLYFLLRAHLLSVKQRKVLLHVYKLLSKKTIRFEAELKQFLPKSHWVMIKDFKKTLQKEIDRFV